MEYYFFFKMSKILLLGLYGLKKAYIFNWKSGPEWSVSAHWGKSEKWSNLKAFIFKPGKNVETILEKLRKQKTFSNSSVVVLCILTTYLCNFSNLSSWFHDFSICYKLNLTKGELKVA